MTLIILRGNINYTFFMQPISRLNTFTEVPTDRYEYDAVGRRTKKTDKTTNEVTEYTWDFRDRLTGIVVKNATGTIVNSVQYKYDVYDQRISKTTDRDGAGALPATTERYVYGTNQNIHLEFDGNGTLTHRYLHGNGIDQIEADEQVATNTVLWALTDHLGSVRDVVDNTGTVRNHIVYDAFGNITSQSDSSVVFRYSYTGREFDKESGQYYYRARYYDANVGRFISEDPIGFEGKDTNLYRYVFNQPTTLKDPSGLVAAAGIGLTLNPVGAVVVIGVIVIGGVTWYITRPKDSQNFDDNSSNELLLEPPTKSKSKKKETLLPLGRLEKSEQIR